MRFILFLASAITAGAVGVTQGFIPLPAQLVQAIVALGDDPTRVRTGPVNPDDASNRALPQIINGTTPEEVGPHGSAATIPRGSFHGVNNSAANTGANGQPAFASSLLSQVQQNNLRMQDTANYARNPAGWHGAPPH